VRTGRVLDAVVPAVLEQRVTGLEATRAWRTLVGQFGEPAPAAGEVEGCPPDLMLSPDAPAWQAVPSWAWHRAGVDSGRAGTVLRAAQRGPRLEELCGLPPTEASAALRSIPGIGQWTAAEVALRAWGDRDAVPFGDFHLAGAVVHALTGRRGGTDAQMAELLVPWAGQRARAVRLLVLHRGHPPRRGPRATITDHRRR
jgi:3-methyladenine DNA glycosylase/8-oxoguanine DNA glycosylase